MMHRGESLKSSPHAFFVFEKYQTALVSAALVLVRFMNKLLFEFAQHIFFFTKHILAYLYMGLCSLSQIP